MAQTRKINGTVAIKVSHLSARVDACIGSTRPDDPRSRPERRRQGLLKLLLNGYLSVLDLPAMVIRPFVFKKDLVSGHLTLVLVGASNAGAPVNVIREV
jgi:hypothetical protein